MSNNSTINDVKDILSNLDWIQPSIDNSYVPISNEKIVDGVYSATADEAVILIDADQSWFWTEEWQSGERAVQADIEAGKIHSYSNVEDAIAALGLEEDAGD